MKQYTVILHGNEFAVTQLDEYYFSVEGLGSVEYFHDEADVVKYLYQFA